ncbi:MAG: hypothetical protein KGZ63_05230 [Clostridiales bacterium]|jgi:hypothetical protein|nr:hypothetical protein [Clostridiales bacterium]
MAIFIYLAVSLLSAILFVPLFDELLRSLGHLQHNYRGKMIPQSMGIVFLPVFFLSAAWANFTGILSGFVVTRLALVVGGFGVLGMVDDIWGDSRARGLGGHVKRLLFHGEITTGLSKAIFGFAVSLWAVSGLPGIFLLIVWRAVLIALSANLLNLLDLRPGRAIKSFLLLSFFYIWQVSGELGALILFPFWLASLVYLPWDLKGRGMLGDAGANVLGGVLGLAIVLTAPAAFQVGYLAALVSIHVLAERVSFTKAIAANTFLRFLDTLGREGWEK